MPPGLVSAHKNYGGTIDSGDGHVHDVELTKVYLRRTPRPFDHHDVVLPGEPLEGFADQSSEFWLTGVVLPRRHGLYGLPENTTCDVRSLDALRRTGFISTAASIPQAAVWNAWARAISRPSRATEVLLDAFCALKGATRRPSSRK